MTQNSSEKKGPRRNAPGAPRCGGKLRNEDRLCQSPVIYPNGRCRKHGGKAKRGVESPSFKHGKYTDRTLQNGFSLGEAAIDTLKKRMSRLVLRLAVIRACERLAVPELAQFVIRAISIELGELEYLVEASPEAVAAQNARTLRRSIKSASATLRPARDGFLRLQTAMPGVKRPGEPDKSTEQPIKRKTVEESEAEADAMMPALMRFIPPDLPGEATDSANVHTIQPGANEQCSRGKGEHDEM